MIFTCSSFFIVLSISVALGALTVLLWRITPAEWLCEYGEIPDIKHERNERSVQPYTTFFQVFFFFYLIQSVALGAPAHILFLHVTVVFSLLQLSISDIKFQILQDQWIVVIAICALAFPGELQAKLQGFLFPIIIYYMLALLQKLWRSQAPFGMGDLKLMAALGFCFGPTALFSITCYALLLSGAWAALLVLGEKATKKDRLFFGPFLSISCVYFMCSTLSI